MKRILIIFLIGLVFALVMFYIKEVREIRFFCKFVNADSGEIYTKLYCSKQK